jgi:hypothetical protein
MVGSGGEVAAEEGGGPYLRAGWGGWLGHDVAGCFFGYCSIDAGCVGKRKKKIPPLRCGMTNKG